jgi:hypothetical protein
MFLVTGQEPKVEVQTGYDKPSDYKVGMPLVTSQEPKLAEVGEAGGNVSRRDAHRGSGFDKYVAALGGADAIQKISSRVVKGTVTDPAGRNFPMEILAKTPDKRLSVIHLTGGDMFALYDGDVGWIRTPGETVIQVAKKEEAVARNMRREDLDEARLQDPLLFAGRVKQVFSDLRIERPEKVEGREA